MLYAAGESLRQQLPQKAAAFIALLSATAAQHRRYRTQSENDRLAQQAETLESEYRAQAAELHRRRLALDPGSVWATYRTVTRSLWQAGQHAQSDAQMRFRAAVKPNDPVYAYGLIFPARSPGGAGAFNTLPTQPVEQQYSGTGGPIAANPC